MSISKGFRYKDKEGKVTDYEYGVNGSNVTQDANHRLVTDEEKKTWNGKADPEDIPSGSAASYSVANNDTTTQAGFVADARIVKQHGDEIDQLSQDLDGNRFGHTADGRPGWKDGADTVHPFSTPAIISMIQLLPGLNNYAENVITFDVSEKNKLHIDTMQSWYDDANISIDADGTVLFSKKHQTGGSNRVDTTDIGDIDVSQYNLITINFSVISKNGQGWGKLNNIIIS